MRIDNALGTSLSVNESLNLSLQEARGAQFAILLSFISQQVAVNDIPDGGFFRPYEGQMPVLEPDVSARELAASVNNHMGAALGEGQGGYFSLLRALSEEFPQLQQVTAMRIQTPESAQQQLERLYTKIANLNSPQEIIEQVQKVRTSA